MVHDWKLGTQVSFGPGRWVTDEASVWDVKAGKELAQTPSKQATWAEEIRARKVAKAQYESPLVAGYRLLPEFTPGRALVWGTILAVWGTMFGTVLASKVTGITTVSAATVAQRSSMPSPGPLEALPCSRAGSCCASAEASIDTGIAALRPPEPPPDDVLTPPS